MKINSGRNLKILGFMFGDTPSVRQHVDYMLGKARKKLWILRHVKKAGMSQSDMLKTYLTVIRPTLDYAVPTYHSMLTLEMRDEIESIQKRACRLIFGWESNYDILISNGAIESLEARRECLTVNFAKKASASARFAAEWFPEKEYGDIGLREERKYKEFFARTERLMKSPLFYMRRALNRELSS